MDHVMLFLVSPSGGAMQPQSRLVECLGLPRRLRHPEALDDFRNVELLLEELPGALCVIGFPCATVEISITAGGVWIVGRARDGDQMQLGPYHSLPDRRIPGVCELLERSSKREAIEK